MGWIKHFWNDVQYSYENTWGMFCWEANRPHRLLKLTKELLAKGYADVNVQGKNKETVLMNAALVDNTGEIVKILLDAGAQVNLQDKDGHTALIRAATFDRANAIQYLIDAGADVNLQTKNGSTALMFAGYSNKVECVEKLASAGADLNAVDKDGDTALMLFSNEPKPAVVEKLISLGADVDLQNKKGETALMLAAVSGSVNRAEVGQKLIAGHAKLDLQDEKGETALMKAVRNPEMGLELVETLLEAGADMDIRNKKGKNVFDIALNEKEENPSEKEDYERVLELLTKAQKQREQKKQEQIRLAKLGQERKENNQEWDETWAKINWEKDSDKEILEKAKGYRAKIESSDGYKRTPLFFAAYYGKAETVQFLIDKKANVNHQDSMGFTPLMAAAIGGHTEVVKRLLKSGARTDITRQGRTALDMIKGKGKTEIEQLLIQAQKKQKNGFVLLEKAKMGKNI